MKKLAVGLALLLTACAAPGAPSGTIDMTALAKAAYVAKTAYDGYLISTLPYLQRPRCGTAGAPITCSDQKLVDAFVKGQQAAGSATQAAENAVRTLGTNPDIVQATVTGAQQMVAALGTVATAMK